MHSRDIALFLSLKTGLVSPQFHVKLDSTFNSLKETASQPPPLWQEKCSFVIPHQRVTMSGEPDNVPNIVPVPAPPMPDQGGADPQGPAPTQPADAPEAEQLPQLDPNFHLELPPLHHSSRPSHPVDQLTYAMACKLAQVSLHVSRELLCLQAKYLQEGANPFALTASTDPNSMYYHQAMQEPDQDKFIDGMQEELDAQIKSGNFRICKKSELPKWATILPGVWQMKRKCCILTQEVYKWKAQLCLDASRQVYGQDYDDMYAPVANWIIIQFVLVLAIINGWDSLQIDYIMAYIQAPVKRDMYMEIPKGCKVDMEGDYVLQILCNIYGQKQAGQVWFLCLVKKLKSIGFIQLTTSPCLFVRGSSIYILYTDDSILQVPSTRNF